MPKQYRVLAGQPMILHTLAAFAAVRQLQGVMVVVAQDDLVCDALAPGARKTRPPRVPGVVFFVMRLRTLIMVSLITCTTGRRQATVITTFG